MPGAESIIAPLIAQAGQRALFAPDAQESAASMTQPGANQQRLAQFQQPMSQQVFGQQPAPPTTPGIDIGQIIALLAQSGGMR